MAELSPRPATAADLPALVELYNHYVRTSAVTFDLEPFTIESRRPWFDQFAATGRRQLLVALLDGQLVGYASSAALRPKAAYDPSVETSIYLAPQHTGRGYAAQLYADLFDRLASEHVHRAYAGITLPNDASVKLHERFGFTHVGVWREVGRKFDQWWDVAWMEKAM